MKKNVKIFLLDNNSLISNVKKTYKKTYKKPFSGEAGVQKAVIDYLKYTYPQALYCASAGGVRTSMKQAIKMKATGYVKGVPDLQIFEPMGKYHGLLIEIKDIEAYVAHAIRIAYYSNRSSYHNLYRKHSELYADITDEHLANLELESVWMADRLTNEQLDIYISRLPFFEREVFYLYALNDFSYDELSRETGIPKSYLYQTVKAAKDELRKSIIRL